jgi:hypothetical protein
VQLPLGGVIATASGTYDVMSTLKPATSSYAMLVATWQQLGGGCPYGAAQALLDAMAIATGGTTHRDPPQADGCRPTSASSLDEQLQAILTAPPSAPANVLPGIAADLAAITATTTLKSTLTVVATSNSTYAAEHTLDKVQFEVNAKLSDPYDLVSLGEPIIDAKDVAFTDDGTTVTVGAHGFTLGWQTLWLQAFADLSLDVRVPGLASPAIPSLVAAIVAPAAHGGKTGCAAVDDLVCTVTTGAGSCALATPCASALAPMASQLSAGFAPTSGIDLTLAGTAMPIDSDGDLLVDLLNGAWSGASLAAGSTFTGTRQ